MILSSHLLKSFLSVAKRHAELIHSTAVDVGPFLTFGPLILLKSTVKIDNEEPEERSHAHTEAGGRVWMLHTSTAPDRAQSSDVLSARSNITWPKMSATRYRRFLKLCEEWPRDESKKGRDLGTFLRQRVASAFREGENTQVGNYNCTVGTQRFPFCLKAPGWAEDHWELEPTDFDLVSSVKSPLQKPVVRIRS